MAATCKFELDDKHRLYYSGGTVTGKIVLQLPTQKYVKDIHLVLHAEGNTFWSKIKKKTKLNGRAVRKYVDYTGKEVYIDNRVELAGEGNIGPGELVLPISVKIPENAPSSYNRKQANVIYQLSVVLDTWGPDAETFTILLGVLRAEDLNLNPQHKLPVQAEAFKTIWCRKGGISYTLSIPHGAYVENQVLPFTLQIKNQTTCTIKGYTVSIWQECAYTATEPHLSMKNECHEMFRKEFNDSCQGLTSHTFKGSITLRGEYPFMPTIKDNKLIQTQYNLVLTVHYPGCIRATEISVPFHIGTKALKEAGK